MPFKQTSVYQWNLNLLARLIIASVNNKYDFNIAVCGKRGCLTGDTLIKTPNGDKSIIEIDTKSNLYSYDFKNKKIVKSYAEKIDSGIKDVYEIETEDGRKIKASLNHIFYVERDNKIIELTLDKLNIGDKLICVK